MQKISYVILSYNSEKYLKGCLESILNVKNFEIEIYICDNGSQDNSVQIIEKLNDNRIHLIKLEKNYGTTVSRNKCLEIVKNTDYICILDSDTIINEEAMQIMTEYLKKHEEVGLVGPAMKGINGEKQIPFRKFPTWKIKLYKAMPIKYISKKGEKIETSTNNDKMNSSNNTISQNTYTSKENQESKDSDKIDINTADIEELDKIPGVGEATANKILNYREENGQFKSIEEIKNVNGIGEKKFENMKELICVK